MTGRNLLSLEISYCLDFRLLDLDDERIAIRGKAGDFYQHTRALFYVISFNGVLPYEIYNQQVHVKVKQSLYRPGQALSPLGV